MSFSAFARHIRMCSTDRLLNSLTTDVKSLRLLGAVLIALLVPAYARAQTPTLTYPANGAVNADMTQPFQWTSVVNVQSYYLYVGTTAGAKNLVDTGGLQTTSYQAS